LINRKKLREVGQGYLFMSPTLFVLLLFIVGPIFYAIFFLFNFILIVVPLFSKLFPEPEIENTSVLFTLLFPGGFSHYAGLLFIVLFPTVLSILLSMMILGIKGLTQWKTTKDKLLFAISILSTISIVSFSVTIFLYPILTIYIVCHKMVRRQNKKPNPV